MIQVKNTLYWYVILLDILKIIQILFRTEFISRKSLRIIQHQFPDSYDE